MSQILRFLLFVVLIAAVSAGVYFYFQENEGVVEKAVEEPGEVLDEMGRERQDRREQRQQPEERRQQEEREQEPERRQPETPPRL